MPDNIRNEIGHFNVFKLDPFVGSNASPCLINGGIIQDHAGDWE